MTEIEREAEKDYPATEPFFLPSLKCLLCIEREGEKKKDKSENE